MQIRRPHVRDTAVLRYSAFGDQQFSVSQKQQTLQATVPVPALASHPAARQAGNLAHVATPGYAARSPQQSFVNQNVLVVCQKQELAQAMAPPFASACKNAAHPAGVAAPTVILRDGALTGPQLIVEHKQGFSQNGGRSVAPTGQKAAGKTNMNGAIDELQAARRASTAGPTNEFEATRPANMAGPTDEFVFPRTGKLVRNRTVLAAMTNRQSLQDGTLSQDEHDWLVMRAAHGFGIVTTACAHVSQDGQGFDGEIGIWSDRHIEGLSQLANSLREHGALGIMQIFHAGMRAPQRLTGAQPVSASANPTEASATGFARKLVEPEIRRIIDDFAAAASRAAAAGFDGVELHGAHGYLICQFLSTVENQRRDRWGGCLENRSRFLFEIIRAVKQAVPSDFLIGVRISPEYRGIELEDSLKLAARLSTAGIDFLHLSCWDSFKGARSKPTDRRTLTEWFTSSAPNLPPIITAGSVWTAEDAHRVMGMGADFVAVARSAIGNPDWANRIAAPDYRPLYPPYSPEHLRKCGLNDTFIHYMGNWQGFVSK